MWLPRLIQFSFASIVNPFLFFSFHVILLQVEGEAKSNYVPIGVMGSSKSKSSKKKSSKIRSQPRKMKRVKKSRSSKSKKVGRHRRDTSFDDSMSSQSVSSASNDSYSLYSDSDSMSSEGTYRGKKKVSSLRNKLKHRRKRVRRRSSRSEDSSCTKKRKKSRKKDDSKSWKKSHKDKSRRNVRHSSATSGSLDRFTCKGESGSLSEGSEVQRRVFASRKNTRDKRESHEERVGTKRRSPRSPSSSPYNRSREQSYSGSQGGKSFDGEHKSRRLRSVIIFAEQAHEEEGNRPEKDHLKEEIVYDCDDYPSLRSNDSSSGGSKRYLNSCCPIALGDKSQKKNVEGQETCLSNSGAVEVIESRRSVNDAEVNYPFLNEVEMHKQEKDSGTYGLMPDANLGTDDLEAVLRRTALENLRKFRGGFRRMETATTNQVNNIDGDAKDSFSSNAEIVQRVSPKQNNVKILERSSRSTSSTQGVSSPPKDAAEKGNTVRGSGIVMQKATHSSDGLALSVSSLKEDLITTHASVVKSESRDSVFGEKALSIKTSLNQEITLQSSPNKKLNEEDESEKKNLLKTAHSVASGIINYSDTGVTNALSEQFTSQGQGPVEEQIESKGGTEFEQKTMSVMRGGEMVQVNYKVYIPKRAPALSRRQLKR